MVILSPIFLEGGTGASTYYPLLARELRHHNIDVTVISERNRRATLPGYVGAFGFTMGSKPHKFVRLGHYLRKNIDYLSLPRLLQQHSEGPVLVHANFFTRPSIFPQMMRVAQRRQPDRHFVVDVRDRETSAERVQQFKRFGRVIACSENVVNHLVQCGLDAETITSVPIPQAPLTPPSDSEVIRQQKPNGRYIFFGGVISPRKAVDRLLVTFTDYIRPAYPDTNLVLAGPLGTTDPTIIERLDASGVHYLGSRPHSEVLALIAGAALNVHLSPNEGLPRSCLEALALQTPVLLPPNVPEFMRYCPDFVAQDPDPAIIAKQIAELLDHPVVAAYPIERHHPTNVLQAYLDVLSLSGT